MALSDFKPMQERCSNCSFCKWIPFDKVKSLRFAENCPAVVLNGWNTYSARGRFQAALAVVNGELTYTDKLTHIVHDCLACGACDVSCKVCRYNLEPLEHTLEFKHDAVINGAILPEQKIMLESLKAEKTLIPGEKKADRSAWSKGIDFAADADVLFFPGCKYSYDEKLSAQANEAAKLLISCGVKLGYLGESDVCCASRLHQMGFFEDFEERAQANIRLFEAKGVKTIVTPCSDCYHAFKRLYAALGMEIEVLHITELLDRLVKEEKLTFTKKLDLTVTYHDPCHLGRQGEPYVAWNGVEKKIRNQIHTWDPPRPRYIGAHGVYDAPRDLLTAIPGVKLAEMERIREYSWCCGAGGGCSVTSEKLSAFAAKERVTEALSTGAEVLATACPWCKSNFESAGGIKVMDVLELVLAAV